MISSSKNALKKSWQRSFRANHSDHYQEIFMAEKDLVPQNKIVKKSNDLIRTRITVRTVEGSRILAHLISCIRTDDTTLEQVYTVDGKALLPADGGKNYKSIKATCRELLTAIAETEEPDPAGKHPVFRASVFFTDIEYKKGVIAARFNPRMRPYLLGLRECFTAYNLTEYLSLPSLYSQRLFEVLKSFANIQSGEVTLSLTELHRFLNSPKSFQQEFKDFRRRVLDKAHQDITAKTSFRYRWDPVKVGRSADKIRFIYDDSRKALPKKELDKAKTEKQRRLHTQRMIRATDCARAKGGDCQTRNNIPIVCKVCREEGICSEIWAQAIQDRSHQPLRPQPPTEQKAVLDPSPQQDKPLTKAQEQSLDAFLARFSDPTRTGLTLAIWRDLVRGGDTPTADDVSDDQSSMRPSTFLLRWKKRRSQTEN